MPEVSDSGQHPTVQEKAKVWGVLMDGYEANGLDRMPGGDF